MFCKIVIDYVPQFMFQRFPLAAKTVPAVDVDVEESIGIFGHTAVNSMWKIGHANDEICSFDNRQLSSPFIFHNSDAAASIASFDAPLLASNNILCS